MSTHTGGFTGYTYRDLSDDIIPVTDHWRSLGIDFDAVYSGFLGSFRQLDIMYGLFSQYKEKGAVIIVDPVLGDNGSLYSVFGPEFVQGMRRLCSLADIITPNITEGALLAGMQYRLGGDDEYINTMLEGLHEITNAAVVLTGVVRGSETGVAMREKNGDVTYTGGRHFSRNGGCFCQRNDGCVHEMRKFAAGSTHSGGFYLGEYTQNQSLQHRIPLRRVL